MSADRAALIAFCETERTEAQVRAAELRHVHGPEDATARLCDRDAELFRQIVAALQLTPLDQDEQLAHDAELFEAGRQHGIKHYPFGASVAALAAPPDMQELIGIYEDTKSLWAAMCFDWTFAPENMKREAHATIRDGLDALCKRLGPIVRPTLKAEFEEASRAARPGVAVAPQEPT